MWKLLAFLVVAGVAVSAQTEPRAAVLIVDFNGVNGVRGTLTFTEKDGKVHVTGKVTGLPEGDYGYNIHEFGNVTGGCDSTGEHFNPDMKSHGHPHDEERHVGDLGNLHFNKDGVAVVDFYDSLLTLVGERSIIGRAVVVHSRPDDHGKTNHPDSKRTGNSGDAKACGVIGIASS